MPEIKHASGWLPVRISEGVSSLRPVGNATTGESEWTTNLADFNERLEAGTARYAR